MFYRNGSKSKKSFMLFAVVMIFALVLSACGNNGSSADATVSIKDRYELDPNTPAWKLDNKEEATKLTWYVNADWWNTDYGNDVVTKKIKEDLNIDITFIKGDDTKLNTLFAGDDMPDLISVFDAKTAIVQKANTWAMPLNDLAAQYDPHFLKVAAEDTMNWFQQEDGKTYGYPNYSNTKEDYASGQITAKSAFIIRKDVYEALGQPSMGTPEEFQAVLAQIKTEFPALLPFGFNEMGTGTSSIGDVFQDFIGVPLTDENGQFYNRNLDSDYMTWLATFNKAYRNGLISDDSFADDSTSFEEKVKSGKYATMMLEGTPQQGGNLQIFNSANPGKEYIAIDGPQSTVGNSPMLNQSGVTGWMINFITNSNVEPAKSIQLFTYLLSEEGQMLMNYGIEGETYQYTADGKVELMPAVKEMQLNNADQYKKEYRLGEFMFFGHDKHKTLSDDAFPDSLKQLQEWGTGKLVPHFILENINPEQGTAEARSLSAVNTQWNTTLVSLIRSKDDAAYNTTLQQYETFLQDNNWEAIVKVYNEKMLVNKEKLGL